MIKSLGLWFWSMNFARSKVKVPPQLGTSPRCNHLFLLSTSPENYMWICLYFFQTDRDAVCHNLLDHSSIHPSLTMTKKTQNSQKYKVKDWPLVNELDYFMYVHLIIICGGSPNCCWKWTPSLDFKTAVLLPVSTCHLMGCTFTGSHTSSFYFQNYSTETHPDSNSVTENGQKLHMKADHLVEFRQRKVLWWRVLGT